MTTPAEAHRIEQRSLRYEVGANAVMALAGFSAQVLTGSSALLLDGLYSAVLVGSSLIASRISRNVVRPRSIGGGGSALRRCIWSRWRSTPL